LHGELAYFCLLYLYLPEVQEQIVAFCDRHNNLQQSPIFDPRFDLLSYAIKYWPSHYKLALLKGPWSAHPTNHKVKFFEDRKAVRCWAEAYRTLSNSATRTDRCFLSPLPIFAVLGLDDLVTQQIESGDQSREFNQDCSLALTEAARNGHTGTEWLLLEILRPSHSTLRGAIMAAASRRDSPTLTKLVEYASRDVENFEWPPDLLCRAVWLGLESVVETLIESGTELDPPTPFRGMSPLHLAARNNHAGVAKLLLEGGASLTFQSLSSTSVLHTACIYGHPTVVKLLVEAGADLEAKDEWEWTLLQTCVSERTS
jgi:ankyrin repeat protein